jgi:hypothetical protein
MAKVSLTLLPAFTQNLLLIRCSRQSPEGKNMNTETEDIDKGIRDYEHLNMLQENCT